MPFPRRTTIPLTLACCALAGVAAGTATANPYPIGPAGAPVAGLGATVTHVGNGAYRTDVNAGSPVGVGYKFQAAFACSRPGTHLEAIQFQAVRNDQPNSSMELRVLSNGARAFGVADSDIPTGGAGKQYNIPVSTCSAAVELNQVEARNTQARVYHLGGLTAVERDDTAPDLGIRSITQGWITGNTARVNWGTYDNYGALGIQHQRVSVAGSLRWQGYPEDGEHGVDIGLDGLPDGAHTVAVEVDGNGTAGTTRTGTLWIDRTPPAVSLRITRLGPWKVRIEPVATDATSNLGQWYVRAGDRVLSSHANNVSEIDLRDIQPGGGAFSATLQAWDGAGNASGVITSNAVNISPLLPKVTTNPHLTGRPIRGEQMSASPGVWTDPSGRTVSTRLQWQRCAVNGTGCLDIPGATGATYTLDDPDIGRIVRVEATGTGAEGSATVVSAPSGPITEPRAGGGGAAAPSPVASPPTRGGSDAPPSGTGVRGTGLVVRDGRRVVREKRTITMVRVTAGEKVHVSTSFRRNDTPAANVRVELIGPKDRVIARGITAADGSVTLVGRVTRGGTWRVVVEGEPSAEQTFVVQVRATIAGLRGRYAVPAFGELVVPGRVVPSRYSGRKLVQLQVLLRGRWSTRAQTTTDAAGVFVMRYQFVLGGGYTVPMRIVAPAERGWPFAPAQSRRFDVVVRP